MDQFCDKDNQCQFCDAFRFKGERNFCCGKVKVDKVPVLREPPEKLRILFEKEPFLKNTRGYKNVMATASVGCRTPDQFKGPNFKIQGKVHHKIGSLIPSEENQPKFFNFTSMIQMKQQSTGLN